MKKNKRIVILGAPCSGKTTLGQQLSKVLKIPHIEVDNLYWTHKKGHETNPNFKPKLREVVTNNQNFIIEGLAKHYDDSLKKNLTHVIFLNPHTYVLVYRSIKRLIFQGNVKEIGMVVSKKMKKKQQALFAELKKMGCEHWSQKKIKELLQ